MAAELVGDERGSAPISVDIDREAKVVTLHGIDIDSAYLRIKQLAGDDMPVEWQEFGSESIVVPVNGWTVEEDRPVDDGPQNELF